MEKGLELDGAAVRVLAETLVDVVLLVLGGWTTRPVVEALVGGVDRRAVVVVEGESPAVVGAVPATEAEFELPVGEDRTAVLVEPQFRVGVVAVELDNLVLPFGGEKDDTAHTVAARSSRKNRAGWRRIEAVISSRR